MFGVVRLMQTELFGVVLRDQWIGDDEGYPKTFYLWT